MVADAWGPYVGPIGAVAGATDFLIAVGHAEVKEEDIARFAAQIGWGNLQPFAETPACYMPAARQVFCIEEPRYQHSSKGLKDLGRDGSIADAAAFGKTCHEIATVGEYEAGLEGQVVERPQVFVIEHHAVEVVYEHFDGLRWGEGAEIGAEQLEAITLAKALAGEAEEQTIALDGVDTPGPQPEELFGQIP